MGLDFLEAFPDGSIGRAVMSCVYRVDVEREELALKLVQFPFLVFRGSLIGLN